MIYTEQHAQELKEKLSALVPHANVYLSTLGGAERTSLMILVVLDARETWANKIMENARHARFSVTSGAHKLEAFVISPRSIGNFRKTNAESVDEIATKIKKWLDKVPQKA